MPSMSFLGNPNYVVRLTPETEARMLRLVAAAPTFAAFYRAAMSACVLRVEASAKANAASRFRQPTGNLLRNIQSVVYTPFLGVVGVARSVPYARRREFGFSGMTDALGRYYANDPGQFYLHDGLVENRPFIEATFLSATAMSVRTLATP